MSDPTTSDPTASAQLEMFVEPFVEAQPGPHVIAALDAFAAGGVDHDLGALATTADGSVDELVAAACEALKAAFAHGATAVQLRIERD